MSHLRFEVGDTVRICSPRSQFDDRICTISTVLDDGIYDYEVDFGPDHLDGHTGKDHDRPSYFYVDDNKLEFADPPLDIPPITDDDFTTLLGG